MRSGHHPAESCTDDHYIRLLDDRGSDEAGLDVGITVEIRENPFQLLELRDALAAKLDALVPLTLVLLPQLIGASGNIFQIAWDHGLPLLSRNATKPQHRDQGDGRRRRHPPDP